MLPGVSFELSKLPLAATALAVMIPYVSQQLVERMTMSPEVVAWALSIWMPKLFGDHRSGYTPPVADTALVTCLGLVLLRVAFTSSGLPAAPIPVPAVRLTNP